MRLLGRAMNKNHLVKGRLSSQLLPKANNDILKHQKYEFTFLLRKLQKSTAHWSFLTKKTHKTKLVLRTKLYATSNPHVEALTPCTSECDLYIWKKGLQMGE